MEHKHDNELDTEHNHDEMTNHDHHHNHHDHSGHDGHEGHDHSRHLQIFKKKFFISLFIGVPILFLAPLMGIELPFQFSVTGSDTLVVILATILFIYGGEPFLSGAKDELKDKNPAMMTLVSLGISVAYIYSMFVCASNTFFPNNAHVMDFFWELGSLILIMYWGTGLKWMRLIMRVMHYNVWRSYYQVKRS